MAYFSNLRLCLWLSGLRRDMNTEEVNEEEVRSEEVDWLSMLVIKLFPLMHVQFAQVFVIIIFYMVFFEVVYDFNWFPKASVKAFEHRSVFLHSESQKEAFYISHFKVYILQIFLYKTL